MRLKSWEGVTFEISESGMYMIPRSGEDVRIHFYNRFICEGVVIGICMLLTGKWF